MQRHHLLPQQLLRDRSLARMLHGLGRECIGFDDFRRNGMLLPASERAAMRSGLPLHRGPHNHYKSMVAERVGQIEVEWSRRVSRHAHCAAVDAAMRLHLLQGALRQRLLGGGEGTLRLNRKDPFRDGTDFTELDAMADRLWAGTQL